MTAGQPHIAVIGGGITGLAAAHHLRELAAAGAVSVRVTLLEAGSRLGGAIRTRREAIGTKGEAIGTQGEAGFLIELGPDNFITNKPAAVALCRRLGLEDQLLPTNSDHRRALVVRKGRLRPIPQGFELMAPRNLYAMALSPIFSPAGKLRMWMEQFIRPRPNPRDDDDESLASFVTRRFGKQALNRLVQPLIGGIYTADPQTLSLRATVPRFLDMEARHGSIIRALRHERKQRKAAPVRADAGARYSLFMTLRDGMDALPKALAASLSDSVRLNRPVRALAKREQGGWRIELEGGEAVDADGVLLAAPSHAAAAMLRGLDDPLADALASIEYAGSAIVVAGYDRSAVKHPLDAFGFVVPQAEGRSIIAGSFSSVKYPGRAPQGHVLLRAFLGGAMQPAMLDLEDDEMMAAVRREFAELLGATGEALFMGVERWPRSMPQYKVGHVRRVAALRSMAASHAGLELAGSAYDGVGIPDCISSGEAAAARLFAAIAS